MRSVLGLKINGISRPPMHIAPTNITHSNAGLFLFRLHLHRKNSFHDLNSFAGLLDALLQLEMHQTTHNCT